MRKFIFPTIITILAIITGLLIIASVTTPPKKSTKIATPTPSLRPYATLSFSPEQLSIFSSTASATQSVDVILDTNGKGVFGIQLELQYDPSAISNVKISNPPNSFFDQTSMQLINTVNDSEGRATYAIGSSPAEKEKTGKGIVATITFTLNPTVKQTDLILLPISTVNNLKDNGSVLLNSATLTITINP